MKQFNLVRKLRVITFLLLFIQLTSSSVFAQDPAQYGTPFAAVPDPRDVNMYQVHIRPYSAAGNLAGVTARLDAIKNLGINVLYLMPIHPVGTAARSINSPYDIKDFKGIGSEYGSLADLRTLVAAAHARGMAVLMDWVVNQTAWDHPWITLHPDWYIRNSSGVIQSPGTYTDVAALNLNNTALRTAMIDAMRYWIFAANIDGFRYDFANNAPISFWTPVISNLRTITSHKLLLLAEGDKQEHFTAGFDMNFGFRWYYEIKRINDGGVSVSQLQSANTGDYSSANSVQQVVRYTTNHDVQTESAPLTVFDSHNGVVANFLVSAYMKGVPFLGSGQEVDFNQIIPFPWNGVKINWTANPGASADFAKILKFRTASNAIRRGALANYSNNDVCAFTKISGSEKVVVIVNLRNRASSFVAPSAMAGNYVDAYTRVASSITSGTTLSLGAFQYRVLTVGNTNVAVTSVSVSPSTLTVGVNSTVQLAATVLPSNATNKSVTWVSSNTAVATVSTSGVVTGRAVGNTIITVSTQDGNRTSTAAVTVNSTSPPPTTRYYIINRWQNIYLYDNNQVVKYATTPTGTTYQWTLEDAGGNKRLKNVGTGRYLNIQNLLGYIQCSAISSTSTSSQWALESYSGFTRIRNIWQSTNYIHVENRNGNAQYGAVSATFWSSHWTLQAVGSTRLSTESDASEDIKVFPNPTTTGSLTIELKKDNTIRSVKIYNIHGNLVAVKQNIGNDNTVNFTDLNKGIYMMVIEGSLKTYSKKIIIP